MPAPDVAWRLLAWVPRQWNVAAADACESCVAVHEPASICALLQCIF